MVARRGAIFPGDAGPLPGGCGMGLRMAGPRRIHEGTDEGMGPSGVILGNGENQKSAQGVGINVAHGSPAADAAQP